MAAVVFHGPPGSYKTSSSIWFEMLIALRAGRIVLTNIEGIKPIDEIEKQLGETFPESADVWRLSTQKKKGLELFRRFFHWAPIGAQIIIDEVQDVFPVERTFKPELFDYQPLMTYKGQIPDAWYKQHYDLLDSIKPDDLTNADYDDLGELIFDDNGHIIYPSTLKESFMRHRKYNWDIVVCTPDITQVNMLIRGACEQAFSYSSKDTLGKLIPYYSRRPRIRQHPAKENGLQARKSDIITFRKVPVDVHKLYKSTSTGKTNVSGVGKSPIQSGRFIAGFAFVVFVLVYLVYDLGFSDSTTAVTKTQDTTANNSGAPVSEKNGVSGTGAANRRGINEVDVSDDVYIGLPYTPNQVFLSGYSKVYDGGRFLSVQMTFELVTDSGVFYVDEQGMKNLGLEPTFISDCFVNLAFNGVVTPIFCRPKKPSNTTNPLLPEKPSFPLL